MHPGFGLPTIAGLNVNGLALDDAEGMFVLCARLGDELVDLFVDGVRSSRPLKLFA